MSVDAGVHPSLNHRLLDPRAQKTIRRYLAALAHKTPDLPAAFRGPNWKKKA